MKDALNKLESLAKSMVGASDIARNKAHIEAMNLIAELGKSTDTYVTEIADRLHDRFNALNESEARICDLITTDVQRARIQLKL
jgi:hypothetical protein